MSQRAAGLASGARATVGRGVAGALREGAARLRLAGDGPRLEAELLLSHVIGLTRTALLTHPERPLRPDEWARYDRLLQRRATGEPLPYLTGRAEFFGLEFAVTPDVLIPRPETELLVELALARRPRRVVDVGTGSGCIAVALAVHLPAADVYALDLAAAALRVAAANARRHGVAERVHLVQGDLCRSLRGPVDVVVSNPPYIAWGEWPSLSPSVRREPRLALDGGADGLRVIGRLLVEFARMESGVLLMEMGAGQGSDVTRLVEATLPAAQAATHLDWAGRERVLEVAW